MSLSVGELYGIVSIETLPAERALTRVETKIRRIVGLFESAMAPTANLDRQLVGLGASSASAATEQTRLATASKESAASEDKAAASASRHAKAMADVAVVTAKYASESKKVQQAALRQVATDQRLVAASAEVGSAQRAQALETAKLASTQASAIGAADRLAKAQGTTAARMTAAGSKMTHSITLPFLAAVGVSVDLAAKFQKSTSVYVTAAGESVKNLGTVRKGIEGVATSTGTSINNLTAGEYAIEKAGFRGAAGIVLLKAASQGAAEENANLSDVIAGATSVMASYHLGTDKSVQVINALKTGAGEAKTTMEEYVKSLSTVIPIASAAGVSLQQVLGAVSTLTQHGTTPAEATQELANTLRNLQAPSNVAIAAMNQIGISSVDVSKNLGARGLTGTFDYIASKLPKTGLVYLSTMKQMEAGTRDLTAMQSKMPPTLLTLSKGFLDGQVTAKAYTSGIKGMGAEGYAQGLQFKALADKVLGYNDAIKNGTPAQKTMASELKAIYGGANGLNTVLQLGGQNLDGFKARTDAVGKSLSATGKDVEGWKLTSQLASIQADKFKESLHVLAINAGNAVLPTLSKLASGATGVVHSFEGLSGTQKEVIGWSVGILAAIGPVMSLTGGLGTRAASLAAFAGATEATASRVALSTQRIAGALAGIGLVYAGTQTGGTAGHLMGAAGGALAGASIGSFIAPGLGTAIGAVAGGVVGLGLSYLSAGDDAKKAASKQEEAAQRAKAAVDAQRVAVQNLTDAISADSDAIGANTRRQVVNDLQKSGALALAQRNNIDPKLVTDAAMGSVGAKAKLGAQVSGIADKAVKSGSLVGTGSVADVAKLNGLLGQEGIVLSKAGKEADLTAEAMGNLNFATRAVSDQARRYGGTLDTATVSGRANVRFIHDHVNALDGELTKGRLTNQQWASQIGTLQTQLRQYGYNAAGVRNYIAGFANIPKSVVTKLLADPKIAHSVIGDVLRAIGTVPKAKNTNLTATNDAKPTITGLGGMLTRVTQPRSVNIDANISSAMGRLQTLLANIPSGTFHFSVVEDYYAHPGHTPPGKATGGIIRGPGTGTSDTAGVYALSNDEAVIPAKAVRANRPLIEALIAAGQGAATGGIVHRGKDWIYGGIRYASERAAENARTRAGKSSGKANADAVTSAIGLVGQTSSDPIDVASLGIDRVSAQIKHATAVLNAEVAKGLSAAATSAARAQIHNLQADANQQLSNLRVKISRTDMAAIRTALAGSADDLRGAFTQIIADARSAGLSSSALSLLGSAQTRLLANQAKLTKAQADLASMVQYRSGISSTLAGGLDSTKYGSVQDLIGGLGGATSTNNAFAGEVAGLRNKAKGNSALTGLINQLAAAGQNPTLQMLAGASSSDLAQVTQSLGGYNASLSAGSDAATTLKFGKSVSAEQSTVTSLTQGQRDLTNAVGALVAALPRLANRAVNLHIGGKQVTATVISDPQFDAYIDRLVHSLNRAQQRGHK